MSEDTGNSSSSAGAKLDAQDSAVGPPQPSGSELRDGIGNEPDPGLPEERSPEEVNRLKKEAVSTRHLLTHLPKNPFCDACRRAKAKRPQRRQKGNRPAELPPPDHFGEQCTADHVFSANTIG